MSDDLVKQPALRRWQESVYGKGPYQVPDYESMAAIVQEHESMADRIEELQRERDEALNQLDSARHSVDVLEKRVAFAEEERRKTFQALLRLTKIHDEVEAKLAKAVEALTPSGDTKAAYIAEVETDCPCGRPHTVSWTATKDIMKMIRERAELKGEDRG